MMMMKRTWSAVVLLLALVPASQARAQQHESVTLESQQKALAILSRGIQATGGLERLRAVSLLKQTVDNPGWPVGQAASPEADGGLQDQASFATLLTDRRNRREVMSQFVSDTSATPRSRVVRTPEEAFIHRLWNGTLRELPASGPSLGLGMPFVGFQLLDAWTRADGLRFLGREGASDVITYSDASGVTVSLAFDVGTGLLDRWETVTPLPPFGRVLTQCAYGDYRDVSGIMVPHEATTRQGGHTRRVATLVDLDLDPPVDDSLFARPSDTPPPAPRGPGEEVEEIGEGVYLIRRPAQQYHSMFIEEDDYVIAVEPVLSPAIGARMIRTIHQTIPGKPIRYLVLTHYHYDHSGGLWPFLAEGVTVVTTPGNRAFIEDVAAAPRPAEYLDAGPVVPSIEVVDGFAEYGRGSGALQLYDVGPNPHVDEILLPYLPALRVAYAADLYGWGMAGTPAPVLLSFADQFDALGLDVERFFTTHADPPLSIEQYRQEVAEARAGG